MTKRNDKHVNNTTSQQARSVTQVLVQEGTHTNMGIESESTCNFNNMPPSQPHTALKKDHLKP